ncbi:DUF1931 family protein [Kribbella sp. NPDC051137]|uniref:DUF1931 family protein n=1 Tax=Kribbella sp. NPDC051137 TaxID=3155045 RepID=UPI00341AAFA3
MRKLYDLLIAEQATANEDRRDIFQSRDLPITKGLQESVYAFRKLGEDVELEPILAQLENSQTVHWERAFRIFGLLL